jgi:hypothetical protein
MFPVLELETSRQFIGTIIFVLKRRPLIRERGSV